MSTGDGQDLIGYELADLHEFERTQLGELTVEEPEAFLNHHFARPESPDDKNWTYSATVSKETSEIELDGSEFLVTEQRGNYPPGSEAIPGVAFRMTAEPTSGTAYAGYFDRDGTNAPVDGFGFGADADGAFTFIAKAGTVRTVTQANWNGPDSISENPFTKHYPRICRFPHLFYGGGAIEYRILDHGLTDDGTPTSRLKTVHIETPETVESEGAPFDDGPPIDQPNLPLSFTTDSLTGAALRANASHYEKGNDSAETRINGEHIASAITVGTTGWTPLISWRKRTGWDPVNVKPLILTIIPQQNDIQLEVQLGTTFSSTPTFNLPTHTDSDETAVEVGVGGTIDTNGERRWPGYAVAGTGSNPGDVESANLDFNLPSDRTICLAAQAVGGSADCTGVIGWEEFF